MIKIFEFLLSKVCEVHKNTVNFSRNMETTNKNEVEKQKRKNAVSETKNVFDSCKSRQDITEEKFTELQGRKTEIVQTEKENKKGPKKI